MASIATQRTEDIQYDHRKMGDWLRSIPLVDEWIVKSLTPKGLRAGSLFWGKLFALIPVLLLFLPVLLASDEVKFRTFWTIICILLMMIAGMAFNLVVFSKKKMIEIMNILDGLVSAQKKKTDYEASIVYLLSVKKQLTWGSIFALFFSLGIKMLMFSGRSSIPIVSITFALMYIGVILGTALYNVACIPGVLSSLFETRFIIKALFPSQQSELKEISELASSITLYGSLYLTLLILMLVASQLILVYWLNSNLYEIVLMTGAIEIIVFIIALIVINIPFISCISFLTRIIRKAKIQQIKELTEGIQPLLCREKEGNADVVDQIIKIQSLIDQIDRSPNTVLSIGTVGKFFSSALLAVVPIIIGQLIK